MPNFNMSFTSSKNNKTTLISSKNPIVKNNSQILLSTSNKSIGNNIQQQSTFRTLNTINRSTNNISSPNNISLMKMNNMSSIYRSRHISCG
jgi:peroxiredoxin family protein